MLLENISIILAVVSLLISIINIIVLKFKSKSDSEKLYNGKKYFLSRKTAVAPFLTEIKTKNLSTEGYLKVLFNGIEALYPNSKIRLSIKIIKERNIKKPEESKVVTWITYPQRGIISSDLGIYTIKNNTDLYSLYIKNNNYFLVSNIKEFIAFKNYKNEERHFSEKWNSVIVVPIQQTEESKDVDSIIGFLCISSLQDFNNVKKNKNLIELIKIVANKLYDNLQKEIPITEIVKNDG